MIYIHRSKIISPPIIRFTFFKPKDFSLSTRIEKNSLDCCWARQNPIFSQQQWVAIQTVWPFFNLKRHLCLLLFNTCNIFLPSHLRWFSYWGCAKQLMLQGKNCLLNTAFPSCPTSTSVAWNAGCQETQHSWTGSGLSPWRFVLPCSNLSAFR